MSSHIGLPLLSGPPPPPSSPGPESGVCRKCCKEFSILFHRQRKCMHCGYAYCSSCTDYQALMPRLGTTRGYDLAAVCAYCIEMLNITALMRSQLRSLPLAKLRWYIDAYNIPIKNPIDKNDFIDAIVNVRTSQGCLPPANEDYYRKNSVPIATSGSSHSHSSSRNTFSRGSSSTHNTNAQSSNANNASRPQRSFPRPDLDPNRRQQAQEMPYRTYTPRSTSNTPRTRATSGPSNTGTARPTGWQSNVNPTTSSSTRQPSSRSTGSTNTNTPPSFVPPRPAAASPVPPPPMSTLITLTRSEISALPIGTLKQILFEARVRVPPGVVEKEELVERAWATIEEERRKNEAGTHDADSEEEDMEGVEEHDQDEEMVNDMVNPEWDAHYDGTRERDHEPWQDQQHSTTTGGSEHDVEMHEEHPAAPSAEAGHPYSGSATPQSPPHSQTSPAPKAKRPPKTTSVERSGLCVICQDEEANIAIVDCGHLAMCRGCSDLVLASSRECPLCRTRIVTEARLLRIFKT